MYFRLSRENVSIKESTTWMSQQIDRNLPLSSLSIPGSHDSLTYDWATIFNPFKISISYWAQTQDLNIYEQLLIGVRYFDIRIIWDDIDKKWYGVHGDYINKNVTYESALKQLDQFCLQYPNEIIIWDLRIDKGGFPYDLHTIYLDKRIISQSYNQKGFSESVNELNKRGQVILCFPNSGWIIDSPYTESHGKINNPQDGIKILSTIYSKNDYYPNVLPILQWISVYDIKDMESVIYSVFYQSKKMNNSLFTDELPPLPIGRKQYGVILIDFVKSEWAKEIWKKNIIMK